MSRASSSRVAIESRIERSAMVESAIDCRRPISAFIGASSTGSPCPSVAAPRRKELTQGTSRNRRNTCKKASRMPTTKTADDQAVEAGIGDKGRGDLTVEDGDDESGDGQKNQHREQENLRAGKPVRIVARAAFRTPGAKPRHETPSILKTTERPNQNYGGNESGEFRANLNRPAPCLERELRLQLTER